MRRPYILVLPICVPENLAAEDRAVGAQRYAELEALRRQTSHAWLARWTPPPPLEISLLAAGTLCYFSTGSAIIALASARYCFRPADQSTLSLNLRRPSAS